VNSDAIDLSALRVLTGGGTTGSAEVLAIPNTHHGAFGVGDNCSVKTGEEELKRLSVLLAVVALAMLVTPASAAGRMGGAFSAFGSQAGVRTAASPGPCADNAYAFIDARTVGWSHALRWRFKASSVPAGLNASSVLAVIKKAFKNIVTARNDCGLPDKVSATQSYLGTTSQNPGVGRSGTCGNSDGVNVVAFAPLDGAYAGYTCIWWDTHHRIVEADIRLDPDQPWATSLSSCFGDIMLESLLTHEIGHAFGLAHVGESSHGRLTMSTFLDGYCENQEATLGWGDIRGLQALY